MNDRCTVLLVDDDPTVIQGLGHMLADLGRLRFATSGNEALRMARQSPPDLVLLDVEMPDLSGFEVCQRMKSDPLLADVPVIFITSHDDPEQELTGLTLGAVDFIHKPPRGPLVLARVRTHLRMKRMADALRRAADTDGLTGIANRRRFDETLAREALRAQRGGASLSLLMVDIDHFKAYNDHFGHPAGDRCLQAVAHAMRDCVRRPADLLARYGGEEFVLLLPDTDAEGAAEVARQLLRAVDLLARPHPASPVAAQISISVGACSAAAGGSAASSVLDAQALVDGADRALYAAKAAGRHRACSVSLDARHQGEPVTQGGD